MGFSKELNPEYLLEGLRLELKLWHLMRRTDSLEKMLKLRNTGGMRRKG